MAKGTITVDILHVDKFKAFVDEIKDALQQTGEFDNFECYHGHKLGTCPNDDCFHCRTFRALESLTKED